jgi:hypothetical protein
VQFASQIRQKYHACKDPNSHGVTLKHISHLDPFPLERRYKVAVGVALQTCGVIEM